MVPVTKPVAHEPPTPAETTLMVLETWLTTQASLSVRGLTETGPSPTGISASNWGLPGWVTSNTDSDEFAVFTANRSFPSAERHAHIKPVHLYPPYRGGNVDRGPVGPIAVTGCADGAARPYSQLSVGRAAAEQRRRLWHGRRMRPCSAVR